VRCIAGLPLVSRKVGAPQRDLDADLFDRVGNRRTGFRDCDCNALHDEEALKQTYGDRLTQRLESLEFVRRSDLHGFIDHGVISDGAGQIIAAVGMDFSKRCRNIKSEFLAERPLFLE
jgi:hypothetical protein